MKYVLLSDYSLTTMYDSVEDAEKVVSEYYTKGGQTNRYIAGVVKGYEAKVPVQVTVVETEDVGRLQQDYTALQVLED